MPRDVPDAAADPNAQDRPIRRVRRVVVGVVLLIMLGAIAVALGWDLVVRRIGGGTIHLLLTLVVALVLAAVPVCVCFVQDVTRSRHLERLRALEGSRLAQTDHFRAAQVNFESVNAVTMSTDFLMPLLVFACVVVLGTITAYCAFFLPGFFEVPSAVLGLFAAAKLPFPEELQTPGSADLRTLAAYQRGCFVMGVTAFLVAYVYVLYRLLDRLHNNDVAPITFYRYSAHILVACLLAGGVWHIAHGIGMAEIETFGLGSDGWLVVAAAGIGVAPELFLQAVTGRAFTRFRIFGMRGDPGGEHRPAALPLLMIDDLRPAQIDRLGELGIQSAQDLATRNPFLLWPRLPFELGQLIAWMGQAQLYVLVRDAGLARLRDAMTPDIFALAERLRDAAMCDDACTTLGLPADAAPALLRQIEADPAYRRLRQVRDALRPGDGAA